MQINTPNWRFFDLVFFGNVFIYWIWIILKRLLELWWIWPHSLVFLIHKHLNENKDGTARINFYSLYCTGSFLNLSIRYLVDSLIHSLIIIIFYKFWNDVSNLILRNEEEMIESLSSDSSIQPFNKSIHIRWSKWYIYSGNSIIGIVDWCELWTISWVLSQFI